MSSTVARTQSWLGVDLGTSGVKVVAVDGEGAVLATATEAYPLSVPQPGWAEQDPQDWWQATVTALQAVVAQVDADAVAGIGLSGQMHGMVALDAADRVLRPAILWNDNRNGAECEWLLRQVGGLDALLELTRNHALPGYTVGKILWLRRHEPELFARTAVVLNPKDHLRLLLTGRRVTEVSDASGTGLLDVARRRWSSELLTALDLPGSIVPELVESSDVTGTLTGGAAALLGLPADTPVVGGGGDSVLQTFSMGVTSPGSLGITLGTAGIVAAASDHCPDNPGGRVQVSCGNAPDRWHVMGTSLTTGGALQWWRGALAPLLGRPPATADLARLAEASPVGARGLRFLPYLTGERCPVTDPEARGAWVGLDLRHDVTDMTRAVIEGALHNLRQSRDVLTSLGLATDDVRISGGASVHPVWSQTLADVLDTPVHAVTGGEQGAAHGAALLAGVGTGRWPSLVEALSVVTVTGTTRPDPVHAAVHDEAHPGFVAIHPALTAGGVW